MKNLALIVFLTSLGLASCGTLPARDESSATDLAVLREGVAALTRERQPQGTVTRAEDVQTVGQANGLLIALEDTNWLQNDDKRRTCRFVSKATRRIELARLPTCSWYEWRCKRRRAEVQAQIDNSGSPGEDCRALDGERAATR